MLLEIQFKPSTRAISQESALVEAGGRDLMAELWIYTSGTRTDNLMQGIVVVLRRQIISSFYSVEGSYHCHETTLHHVNIYTPSPRS